MYMQDNQLTISFSSKDRDVSHNTHRHLFNHITIYNIDDNIGDLE